MQDFLNKLIEWCATSGIKIVIALVVMIVAFIIINSLSKRIEKRLLKKGADKTLTRTLDYFIKIGLKIVVVVCLIGYLGFDTSGIAALLATFGVAIGLAVQGAFSNLAGGIMLIITRPFRVDDYIESSGVSGTVTDIHIIYTVILTPDNKEIMVPNGTLANANIINYSKMDLRRVDCTFSIAYNADFRKAQQLIYDVYAAHELVLDDPAPMVRMKEHGESSINLTARCWVKNADYWTVFFDVTEQVKDAFDSNGIEIPFPQLDVHTDVKNS